MTTQALAPLSLEFTGNRLIEASAGTGKTYTISGLYLRLLLGHQHATPLTCEQILVVTFTNAATEELRDRIRKRVQLAYKRFIGIESINDDFIEQLYQQIDASERDNALRRLDLALKSLDEGAIFTIHGFCQRILSDMAFESSILFESEFTLDDSEYLHHAVRDFWREACYPLPVNLAQSIAAKYSDPDQLARDLRPLLGATVAKAQPTPQAFDKHAEQLADSVNRLMKRWPTERAATEELLHSLPLNGVRFGKKTDGYPKLAVFLDAMDNWCNSGDGLPPAKALEVLALSELKLNKGGQIPTPQQAPVLDHIEQLNQLMSGFISAFVYFAQQGIKRRFNLQKHQKNLLTPDDLLQTLSDALEVNPVLAERIAERFPVALIDEFQDTDPLQFNIFSSIYPVDKPENGLLMIGDPKQAIYAFRGADIYTYINARKRTEHHYNLTTNYRSSQAMVHGVNELFSHSNDPFISDAIPFDSVLAADEGKAPRFIDKNNDSAALRLRLVAEDPEKGLNKTSARQYLADDVANEIAMLLNQAANGECSYKNKPLKAQDIAVLVRDRNEASFIKKALTKRDIGAVFLSRDNVFSTIEATEMALILTAILKAKDERAIRSAMATSLLGYSAFDIMQFNQDEEHRQQQLTLFFQLNQLWQQRGIMPALMMLAQQTSLIERLLSHDNGERKLTDFRHLAELLQQQATELDGPSALVNWFEQSLINPSQNEAQQLRLESEQNLVKIVTIHKSKGLEYPVCFAPFTSLARDDRRKPSPMLYHTDEELIWDIDQSEQGWDKHKQEVLAEDLRLLYVALTRAAGICYLYIANHSRFTKSKGISSLLPNTAIGYLLGITTPACEFEQLSQAAATLASAAISVNQVDIEQQLISLEAEQNICAEYQVKPLLRQLGTPWRVGSYSGLVKHLPHERILPGDGDEVEDETVLIEQEVELAPSRFTFERGANAGSFMHEVLEVIEFNNAEATLIEQLPFVMDKFAIDNDWQQVLLDWYQQILAAPLTTEFSLNQLHASQMLVEMEFYLPIGKLTDSALTALLQQYGYHGQFSFDALQGMLKLYRFNL